MRGGRGKWRGVRRAGKGEEGEREKKEKERKEEENRGSAELRRVERSGGKWSR